METVKYILTEAQIPTSWYNVQADLPTPAPPVLHPGTGQPIGPADLAPLFPMALLGQAVSPDTTIEIPDEVRDIYRLPLPHPLFRALPVARAPDTPSPTSNKPDPAITDRRPTST